MNKKEIEAAVEARLAAREAKVRNRNALNALFGAFSDPIGSLGRIFLGGNDAVNAEQQRLQQEAILDLLCRIDDAITQIVLSADAGGFVISGLIETSADSGESVVGVDIAPDAGPVRFEPGTHIKTSSFGVMRTTGLKIGGKLNE